VKWHLSIDDWQTSEDWLNASDCDLVILDIRTLGYNTNIVLSFQPICNWLWQWDVDVFNPRPFGEIIRVNHKFPSFDFGIVVKKVKV
jgi:hypothetical protein